MKQTPNKSGVEVLNDLKSDTKFESSDGTQFKITFFLRSLGSILVCKSGEVYLVRLDNQSPMS